ncbi:hypothetical protein J7K42_02325 [bacterium]|nr:hypothetical protein [bacterium]
MWSEIVPKTTNLGQPIQKAKEIFQFLVSPQLQEQLFVLKIICITISVLFFLAILYLLARSSYLNEVMGEDFGDFSSFRDFSQRRIARKWEKIKKRFKKGTPAQQKLSLLEGLEMFDNILKRAGFAGESLTERLEKLTEDDISNLSSVKEAVQVCQDIARDPDYLLSKEKAEEVIDTFEKVFKDLEIF